MDPKSHTRFFVPPLEKTHEIPDAELNQPRRRILVVEDDIELTEVLRSYLHDFNFDVVAAPNGAEGVKKIMADDFNVVLCDMMMPHLPGDMFYRAVERARPHLCRRFIFMTGYKGDKKIDEFIRSVRGVILFKPFQPHVLMDTINLVLAKP